MAKLPEITNDNQSTISALVAEQKLSNENLKNIHNVLLQNVKLDRDKLKFDQKVYQESRTSEGEKRDEQKDVQQTDKDGNFLDRAKEGTKKGLGFFKAIAPLLGLGALAFFVDNPDAISTTVDVITSIVDFFGGLSDGMQAFLGAGAVAAFFAPGALTKLIGGVTSLFVSQAKRMATFSKEVSAAKKAVDTQPKTTKSGAKPGDVIEDKKGGKKQIVQNQKTGAISAKAVPKSTPTTGPTGTPPAANQNVASKPAATQAPTKKPFDLAKKFPRAAKVMGLARKFPIIGPALTGVAAVSLLSSDASPKEKTSGLAGILGGIGGGVLGGFLGSMAGALLGPPGALVGGILGAIGGGLGGDIIAQGIAQYMLGQKVDAFPDSFFLPDINAILNGKDVEEEKPTAAPAAPPPKPTPKPASASASAPKITTEPPPSVEAVPKSAPVTPKMDSGMSEALPVEEIPELPVATAESKPKPSPPAVQKKAAEQIKKVNFNRPENYIDYSKIENPTQEDIDASKRQVRQTYMMNRIRGIFGYHVTHANGTRGYVPAEDIQSTDMVRKNYLVRTRTVDTKDAEGNVTGSRRQSYFISQQKFRENLGLADFQPPPANSSGMQLEATSRAANQNKSPPVVVNQVNQTDASTNVSNQNQSSGPINPVNNDKSLRLGSGA